jgi:hypothetical protein
VFVFTNVLRDGRLMTWRYASSGSLSPKRLALVRRDAEVLDLCRQGFTYAAIASTMGYAGASGPYKAAVRALARCTHPDRPRLIHLEYERLEALYAPMAAELATNRDPARQDQLIAEMLHVLDVRAELTDNYRVGLPKIRRRSPARRMGVWTDALQQRLDGAKFDEIAAACGLSDGSAARKRVAMQLDAFAGEAAENFRTKVTAHYDHMQYLLWDEATAEQPSLTAVDAICEVISRRISINGLAPPKYKKRRRPLPGPKEAIHTYLIDSDRDPELAAFVEQLMNTR